MTSYDVSPVSVMLVDDHEFVRMGLQQALEQAGGFDVVASVGTCAQAVLALDENVPAVAIVDLRLPDGDGVELVREIRSRQPHVRCLILTSFADDDAFCQAVLAGASGYIIKDAATHSIIDAVGRAVEGRTVVLGHTPGRVPRPDDEPEPRRDVLEELTPQERRIFNLITEGLTNREIAAELSLAEKTVRNYVSNALGKVGMRNRTQVAAHISRTRALVEARDAS